MGEISINATNVTKAYGDFKAIDDLSLQVDKGCLLYTSDAADE